jgi:peptide deformylase
MIQEIRQLGDPVLRVACTPVKDFAGVAELFRDLSDTLYDFKTRNGFGRGIAAPQIGRTVRAMFIHSDAPLPMVNPVILRRSRKMQTLWDDCFSFPTLLVKVRRHLAITVRYQDVEGKRHTVDAEGGIAELLQHEIDHLDGILAIDRAVDSRHIIFRSEYEKHVRHAEGVVL